MSSKFKFELDRAGVRELLRSGEVMTMLEDTAASRMGSLGEGYAMNSMVGTNRCNVRVIAVSAEAVRENLENNTLLQVIS